MSKKQKLGKSPIVSFFEAMEQNKRIKEQFVNLSNFKLGCDPAIAGGDKTVEYFVYSIANEYNMPHIYEKIKGASISIDKLSEQLNKLKDNETMKITEETKLKDLIPEGYEIDDTKHWIFESSPICQLHIPAKKKQIKDFGWYVGEYMNSIFINLKYKVHGHVCESFRLKNYDKISFEMKIGLLKFICDDIGINMFSYLKTLNTPISSIGFKELERICPPEFINSMFI